MKVALIQLNAGQNKQENILKVCMLVEKAIDEGGEFILLPEVFNYRGPSSGKDLIDNVAEKIPDKSINPLMEIAKKSGIYILAGSIYERSEDERKVYNTSIIINDSGKLIGKYRKINLFKAVIDGQEIDEADTYLAGDGSAICEVKGRLVGLSICFDLRFPELYREYYKQKVDIIVVPSSFTTRTGKLHWEILLRARAIENYCYVLSPNQYGIDGNGVETFGHSMVIDPQGRVVDVLGKQIEGILMAKLLFENQSYYPSLS